MSSRARCRGVTLVELVVTIVVITAAVSAVLAIVSSTAARSAENVVQTQAVMIAQSYLNEVIQKPFGSDCAPTCARVAMDKVDDYNGLVDAGVHDQTGTAVSGLGGYTVSVSVANRALGTAAPVVPAAQSRLITVTVLPPDGPAVVLSAYRTSYR